ncbi:MAG TPA: hypothetical protein VFQ16_11130 [Burkholderiaceae bacterium]|nr:hypothetical protein [Burkholderiaceae bacterium]
MTDLRPSSPVLLLLAGGVMLSAAPAAWGQQRHVFTCVNAQGRTLTSDRLIAECMDREQRVLAKDGTLIRIVPPQLTAEERAEKEARDQKAAAGKAAQAEAVRRDRSLAQRYPNEAAHAKAREKALDDIRSAIRISEARQQELERERKPLQQEAEFYQGKPMPAKLRQQLDANDAATAAQRDIQKNQHAELERVTKLFDDELSRLKRLWAGAAPGSLDAPAGAASSPAARGAKGPATPAKPAASK